jgi:hypothetical protein
MRMLAIVLICIPTHALSLTLIPPLLLPPTRSLQESTCIDNVRCSSAKVIDTFPFSDTSSNEFTLIYPDVSPCWLGDPPSRVSWYSLQGTNETVRFWITTNYTYSMTVSEGSSCELMNCTASGLQHDVILSTALNTTYWIMVVSPNDASNGNYTINGYVLDY